MNKKMIENQYNTLKNWKIWCQTIMVVSLIGIIDASYLTFKSFTHGPVPCSITNGCADVLTSQYSSVYGLPTSVFGVIFYLLVLVFTYALFYRKKVKFFSYLFWLSAVAFLVSFALVYIQLFTIKAICPYCMVSALLSTVIFTLLVIFRFSNDSPLKQKREEETSFVS